MSKGEIATADVVYSAKGGPPALRDWISPEDRRPLRTLMRQFITIFLNQS
jgi:hypothetical protein